MVCEGTHMLTWLIENASRVTLDWQNGRPFKLTVLADPSNFAEDYPIDGSPEASMESFRLAVANVKHLKGIK